MSRRGMLSAAGGGLLVSVALPVGPAASRRRGSAREFEGGALAGCLDQGRVSGRRDSLHRKGRVRPGAEIRVCCRSSPSRWHLARADHTGDSGYRRTPNEGFTAGSHSMQDSGTALMIAAAQARRILMAAAGAEFGVVPEVLRVTDGVVRAPDGATRDYGMLARCCRSTCGLNRAQAT